MLQETLRNNLNMIVTRKNCPFCEIAMRTLHENHVDFKEFKAEENEELVKEITNKERHKTFPMIYLKGSFIGGNDKLQEHYSKENKANKP